LDSCGNSCGTCPAGTYCHGNQCLACVPVCSAGSCGDDGCGGTCKCPSGETCVNNKCVCIPQCNGKICGADGVGE
jgi:hypothetical protein